MQMREDLHISGRLTLRKTTLDGQLVEEVTAHNEITLAGRDLIARLFRNDQQNVKIGRVTKMLVGRSQAPFDAKQTALVDKVAETPITNGTEPLGEVPDTNGRTRKMLRLIGELGENDANDALREAGLFTEDNVMYNRVTFDTVTKSKQFKLTLVWEILF